MQHRSLRARLTVTAIAAFSTVALLIGCTPASTDETAAEPDTPTRTEATEEVEPAEPEAPGDSLVEDTLARLGFDTAPVDYENYQSVDMTLGAVVEHYQYEAPAEWKVFNWGKLVTPDVEAWSSNKGVGSSMTSGVDGLDETHDLWIAGYKQNLECKDIGDAKEYYIGDKRALMSIARDCLVEGNRLVTTVEIPSSSGLTLVVESVVADPRDVTALQRLVETMSPIS